PAPPPAATILPYTTLFRSPREPARRSGGERRPARSGGAHARKEAADRRGERRLAYIYDQPGGPRCGGRARRREGAATRDRACAVDRKSTRLNSSHQIISYA